ncbi:hypothetical protein [Nocardia sp. NPDC020380]
MIEELRMLPQPEQDFLGDVVGAAEVADEPSSEAGQYEPLQPVDLIEAI